MTSEELELEQIEKERKEVKEMMRKNMALYYRLNNIHTTQIIPKNTSKPKKYSEIQNNIFNSFPINNINLTNNSKQNILKTKELNNIINNTTTSIINKPKEIIIECKNELFFMKKKEKKVSNTIELKEEEENCKEGKKVKKNKKEVKKMKNEKISNAPKTPMKDSLYLKKVKELGSMSKLSLYNKIKKCTEVCKEVLKQQKMKNKSKK